MFRLSVDRSDFGQAKKSQNSPTQRIIIYKNCFPLLKYYYYELQYMQVLQDVDTSHINSDLVLPETLQCLLLVHEEPIWVCLG